MGIGSLLDPFGFIGHKIIGHKGGEGEGGTGTTSTSRCACRTKDGKCMWQMGVDCCPNCEIDDSPNSIMNN